MDFAAIQRVLAALEREGVAYAIFGDLMVNVVSPRTLYLMKRDTVRLKDKADAAMLRERFGLEDE